VTPQDIPAIFFGAFVVMIAVLYSGFAAMTGRPRPWIRSWLCLSAALVVVGGLVAWRGSVDLGLTVALVSPFGVAVALFGSWARYRVRDWFMDLLGANDRYR
jgi:heme A synthase